MARYEPGTYVKGVRIDDLRGTLKFKHLEVVLTYFEAAALRVEVEGLLDDMITGL